jgi:hypothetical protein
MKIIAPADAFRMLLQAQDSTLDFANKVSSYDWFLYPELSGASSSEYAAVDEAIKRLCTHVRAGEIRVRGERQRDPPADIDPADCKVGELDVFNQTLTVFGQGFEAERVYRRVYCVETDVLRIVRNISKNRAGPVPRLKPAPPTTIRQVIASVYDEADKGGPRPNINKLPTAVRAQLEALGYEASGRKIKKIGREPQFARRRGEVGKRLS